ncbi:hypothetical protein [Stigmatella aurantiaca]|uniref:Conserved uncharacterized protein n=1 Tax=Stigmatella aurantiaca (strain DW4/3-1) TaxID=378806 RepID=Q08UM0_STIAD|nr:hypothetical protein [Stigmatella aurantiaca]ADO68958.1 conserved uncharacterized protein [Stigmatella aurantiaca DW4/3-1]EAU64170.1 conserved hypothetical protein [Stigmatella aurantiaca DW4/3-1]
MKVILEYIAARQHLFAEHPFFEDLKLDRPIEQIMAFAPKLAFWVMTFQDVLRLNAHFISDPALKQLTMQHRSEEIGHDRWFFEDIAELTGKQLTVSSLFGRAHTSTRDATYALISEVYRPMDDRLRIALVLTMEATSHVFFSRTATLVAAKGSSQKLRYFSDFHVQVEAQHEVFEEEMERRLRAMELPEELRVQGLALVERTYTAFDAMMQGLRQEVATALEPLAPTVAIQQAVLPLALQPKQPQGAELPEQAEESLAV